MGAVKCEPVIDVDQDTTESGEKAGPISVFHDYAGDKAFWIAQFGDDGVRYSSNMVGMSRPQAERVRDALTHLLELMR